LWGKVSAKGRGGSAKTCGGRTGGLSDVVTPTFVLPHQGGGGLAHFAKAQLRNRQNYRNLDIKNGVGHKPATLARLCLTPFLLHASIRCNEEESQAVTKNNLLSTLQNG